MTNSSGSFLSLLLMKRSRCFWCMHALWWMCVSTCRTTANAQHTKESSHVQSKG